MKAERNEPEVIITAGELFEDGASISQVQDHLLLLVADGEEQISSKVSYHERTYVAAPLDPAMEILLRLSSEPEDYTSVQELFSSLASAARTYVGLDESASTVVAAFVLATAVVESLPHPPCLQVCGPAGSHQALFDFLGAVCRHPLRLAEPTARALARLPRGLRPTILIADASRPACVQRLLKAAVSGSSTVLPNGGLFRLQSPIVVAAQVPFNDCAISIPLHGSLRPIPEAEQRRLAAEYQPKLLTYRACQHRHVALADCDVASFSPGVRLQARALMAAVAGVPELQLLVAHSLEAQHADAQVEHSQSPAGMVLEALLVLVREGKQGAFVAEIAELASGIALGRNDALALTSKAAGGILRWQLGFQARRQSRGYHLALDPATCASIHNMASVGGVLSVEPTANSFCVAGVAVTEDLSHIPSDRSLQTESGNRFDDGGAYPACDPNDVHEVPGVHHVHQVHEVHHVHEVHDIHHVHGRDSNILPGGDGRGEVGTVRNPDDEGLLGVPASDVCNTESDLDAPASEGGR